MKITIYELLGMIKDGNAPKKIKYDGCNYVWNEYEKDYERTDINDYLFDNSIATDILNEEVEILEITITYKQDNIEKVDEPYESVIFKTDYEFATELEKKIIDNIELIRKKQDEIIDFISKEEE